MSICLRCRHEVTGDADIEECLSCQYAGGALCGHANMTGWPMVSEALACGIKQVEQMNERAKRNGIQVTYDKQGFCHIPDKINYAKILKLEKLHNKAEGFHGA